MKKLTVLKNIEVSEREDFVRWCYQVHEHQLETKCLRSSSVLKSKAVRVLLERLRSNHVLSNSEWLNLEQHLSQFFGRVQYIVHVQPALYFARWYLSRSGPLPVAPLPQPLAVIQQETVEEDDATTITSDLISFQFVANCLAQILSQGELLQRIRNGSLSFGQYHRYISTQYAKNLSKEEFKFLEQLVQVFVTSQCEYCHIEVVQQDQVTTTPEIDTTPKPDSDDWWERLGYPTIKVPSWARSSDPNATPEQLVSDKFTEM